MLFIQGCDVGVFVCLLTGVDSSEDDESGVEEELPYQHEWLLSSDSDREEESP